MQKRLSKIDELTRPDHHRLCEYDECLYAGEYTARRGFAHSETNNIIINLKKPVNRRGLPEYRHKGIAINNAAAILRAGFTQAELDGMILVPVPSSRIATDPLYDDRMLQVARRIAQGSRARVIELVEQVQSTDAAHDTDQRPSPGTLAAIYKVKADLLQAEPETIFVVDDVLTTGSHFVAMKSVLAATYPRTRIVGLFVARRAPEAIEFSPFTIANP